MHVIGCIGLVHLEGTNPCNNLCICVCACTCSYNKTSLIGRDPSRSDFRAVQFRFTPSQDTPENPLYYAFSFITVTIAHSVYYLVRFLPSHMISSFQMDTVFFQFLIASQAVTSLCLIVQTRESS